MEKYGPTRGRFLPTHVEPFFHFQKFCRWPYTYIYITYHNVTYSSRICADWMCDSPSWGLNHFFLIHTSKNSRHNPWRVALSKPEVRFAPIRSKSPNLCFLIHVTKGSPRGANVTVASETPSPCSLWRCPFLGLSGSRLLRGPGVALGDAGSAAGKGHGQGCQLGWLNPINPFYH